MRASALASLSSDGTSFKLYTLNLGSGAATPFNAPEVSIDAGGASVTGLTLALLP